MHHTLHSNGHPFRLEAHEPLLDGTSKPAILLLHGAGGNVANWIARAAPTLNQAGIALFAPHYFEATGTTYADLATITDGVHVPRWLAVLDSTLAHLATIPSIDATRVCLAGISLGAFLSLAYAATHPHAPLRCLIDVSGGLVEPFRSQATAQFPPTLILHGESDTVVPVSHAHSLAQRLTELHIPHTLKLLPNEGHWFSAASQWSLLLAVSTFLQQHLDVATV